MRETYNAAYTCWLTVLFRELQTFSCDDEFTRESLSSVCYAVRLAGSVVKVRTLLSPDDLF